MQRALIESARNTLWMVLDDEPPNAFSVSDQDLVIFRRLVEMQAEHCDAVDLLCENRLFRPAHSILRSFLEASATLVWIGHDIKRYGSLFLQGNQPNIREILRRIGWDKEYDTTYKLLSSLVHIDSDSMLMYRHLDFGRDGLFPEILPDAENYIMIDTEGNHVMVGMPVMSREEAASLYGPYLEAKVFDLTLCSLWSLYGVSAKSHHWWPLDKVRIFEAWARNDSNIRGILLWPKVK